MISKVSKGNLDEEVITISLRRVSGIRLIKQVLYSHKNLFYSNGWSPSLDSTEFNYHEK